jgi:ABC-type glycerol-3-phosphate transport system substrate-binding protein
MPPGRAAEPLADGWSAYAFLARAASQTAGAWLFDRQTLAPRITDPPYQRALEQLVEDAKQYPEQLLTPDQIWEQLASDQLDVAIGWPTTLQTEDAEQAARLASLQMVDYPRGAEVYLGTWQASLDAPIPSTLPPRGMVAAIAATCRQTTIARNLLNHLADAEAREQLRSTTDWVWPLRDAGESDGGLSLPLRSRYDALLRAQLAGGQIRPSLRLPGARRYLQALDQNVRRAIAGEHDADQALAEVAEQWEAITEALGRRKQVRAWRQAQGMRAR